MEELEIILPTMNEQHEINELAKQVHKLHVNCWLYNIQNKTDLVKIKRVRITKGKIIDITSNQDRILGNSFILQLSNSAFNKLSNSTVAIKFNSQKKDVMVTSIKNYFSF